RRGPGDPPGAASLEPAQRMDAQGGMPESPSRLLGELDLGDQMADRRIAPGECDAGRLADRTAPAVAPDEIFGAHRPAAGQRDVDAGVILRKTGHLASAIDLYGQLLDPAGQDAFEVLLP